MNYSKIPPRIYFHGDKVKAETLRGFGKKFLSKHLASLAFKNLPDGRDSIRLSDGSIVEVTVSFGESTVHITSPVRRGGVEERPSCLCGKFFTEAVVIKVNKIDGYEDACSLYDVDVCQANGTQITAYNCVVYDFAEYVAGERVMVCLSLKDYIPILYCTQGGVPWFSKTDETNFVLSQPFGYMGSEQGYEIFEYGAGAGAYECNDTLIESIYGCNFMPPETDENPYPCSTMMCTLGRTIENCCRMLYPDRNVVPQITKNTASVTTILSMGTRLNSSYTVPEDKIPNGFSPFNLQIVKFDKRLINAKLKVGYITAVNVEDNTVDVNTVDKFSYDVCDHDDYVLRTVDENIGDVLTSVSVDMKTTSATGEEGEDNLEAWRMFIQTAWKRPGYDGVSGEARGYPPSLYNYLQIKGRVQYVYVAEVENEDAPPTHTVIGVYFNKYQDGLADYLSDNLNTFPAFPLMNEARQCPVYDVYLYMSRTYDYVFYNLATSEYSIASSQEETTDMLKGMFGYGYPSSDDYYFTRESSKIVSESRDVITLDSETYAVEQTFQDEYDSGGFQSNGDVTPFGEAEKYAYSYRVYEKTDFVDEDHNYWYKIISIEINGYSRCFQGQTYEWDSTDLAKYLAAGNPEHVTRPPLFFGAGTSGGVWQETPSVNNPCCISEISGSNVCGVSGNFYHYSNIYDLAGEKLPVVLTSKDNEDSKTFTRDHTLEALSIEHWGDELGQTTPAIVLVKPRGLNSTFFNDNISFDSSL